MKIWIVIEAHFFIIFFSLSLLFWLQFYIDRVSPFNVAKFTKD